MNRSRIAALPFCSRFGRYMVTAGLLLILSGYLFIDGNAPFPGWRALLPVLGAVLVITAPGGTGQTPKFLSSRAAISIGLISYPLYLIHWPLFSFARIILGTPGTADMLGLSLFSLVLAWAIYHWVEIPIRFGRGFRRHTAKVATTCLLLLLALGGLGDFTRSHHGFPGRVEGAAWNETDWPESMIMDPACAREFQPAGDYCMRSHPGKTPEYVLIGDSHANHFFPGLAKALESSGKALLQIKGPLKQGDETEKNTEWIVNHGDIGTVFISYHQGRINQEANPFGPPLENLLNKLLAANKRVYIIEDNPDFDFDPRLCTERPKLAQLFGAGSDMQKSCAESLDYQTRKRAAYNAYLKTIKARFTAVGFIDAFSPVCPQSPCTPMLDGHSLFRDRHHLTKDGSEFVFAHISIPK